MVLLALEVITKASGIFCVRVEISEKRGSGTQTPVEAESFAVISKVPT